MNNGNLIVNFRPFVLKQQILVYQEGVCIKQAYVPMNDVVPTVDILCKEYNIPRVNLCGNTHYTSKFAEKLQTRFANNNREIEIFKHS